MTIDEEIYQRLQPKKTIKEELGGGYYWRCPYLLCDKIVRSDWDYCPYCGSKLIFDTDDYTCNF